VTQAIFALAICLTRPVAHGEATDLCGNRD